MRSLISLAFVLSAFAACSPYSPELGDVPFLCGSAEPRCPDGYTCMAGSSGGEYCLAPNGVIPIDAPATNCANDQQLEPNNDYMTAFQTPVATQKSMLTFAGLAICPDGDKDTYALSTVAANQNIELTIEYEDGGAALSASILNGNGTPIMNASPVTGMPRVIKAMVPNVPVGVYYAQVYGPPMGAVKTNNYKMSIVVTGGQ